MKYLFLHPNFPAQFRHLAVNLAADPKNQVVFGTKGERNSLQHVIKILYRENGEANPKTHRYVIPLESAVWQGQAVYRMGKALEQQGFVPDIIVAHSGWGPGLFIKDLYPKSKYFGYFEWFYHARGTDADFDPDEPLDEDTIAKIRIKNAPILVDLYSCDRGLVPTHWQHQQFPPEYHPKLDIIHEGIDTDYFKPEPNRKLIITDIKLNLTGVREIVTYAGRGMEPYRGFPQFMEAAYLIQKNRPGCHIVVMGEDRVAYGKTRTDGKTYKEAMLEKFPFDLSRLHFTGPLPYKDYLRVLQASKAHIYLTRPFVLSWSMLEAMSTGAVVIGSDTPPVKEVIEDNYNGLLVNFFDPEAIAARTGEILEDRERAEKIGKNARETIIDRYDLKKMLDLRIKWLHG